MDKQIVELLARRAGLEKALALFTDDVAAAAMQAEGVAARIDAPTDPAAEPWPPMRVGACLLPSPPPPVDRGGARNGSGR